jgi:hypothetical protein
VDESIPRNPVIEAYKKDIDRTLLRANPKLTSNGPPTILRR